jgi:hypothetical protein
VINPHAAVARRWSLCLLLPLALLAGCAKTSIAGVPGVGGPAVENATLSIGDQQFRFDACSSGDLLEFLGVDLVDRQGGAAVRLVIDPSDGPRIRILYGAGGARQRVDLTAARCRQFEANAQPTSWMVNDVRDVSGFVDVECAGDPGPAISLHARFSHCH